MPIKIDHILGSLKFTATDFMSMAAKSSDLGDKMSEANLQADG